MKLTTVLLSSILFLTLSCDDDDAQPKGAYTSGVFIVNEGNFQDADGTISHFNPQTTEVSHDLFGTNNDGRALGDVVQSLTVAGDTAYILVNNSNKIEVVHASTFESINSIEAALPRYMITLGSKGYVTEWNDFNSNGRVSVINLSTLEVEKSIAVGFGPEHLIRAGSKIFVANTWENSISVIDPITETVLETINTPNSPADFAIDKTGQLWVLCKGGFDQDFAPLNDGVLLQIDPNTYTLENTIELNANTLGTLLIDRAHDDLFYAVGNSVFRVSISATTAPVNAFIAEENASSFYGIGIDPATDEIYAADALSFAANGKAYRYTSTGQFIEEITTGRGPNNFTFR